MHVRFSQSCPTCGRRVEISAALLGRTVACQHCRAEFVANVGADAGRPADRDQELMDRVEQVLARAASQAASAERAIPPSATANTAAPSRIA